MSEVVEEQETKAKFEFGQQYAFTLRQHKSGPFSGLWELNRIEMPKRMIVAEVIADADALPFCIENMQGRIEKDGF